MRVVRVDARVEVSIGVTDVQQARRAAGSGLLGGRSGVVVVAGRGLLGGREAGREGQDDLRRYSVTYAAKFFDRYSVSYAANSEASRKVPSWARRQATLLD